MRAGGLCFGALWFAVMLAASVSAQESESVPASCQRQCQRQCQCQRQRQCQCSWPRFKAPRPFALRMALASPPRFDAASRRTAITRRFPKTSSAERSSPAKPPSASSRGHRCGGGRVCDRACDLVARGRR